MVGCKRYIYVHIQEQWSDNVSDRQYNDCKIFLCRSLWLDTAKRVSARNTKSMSADPNGGLYAHRLHANGIPLNFSSELEHFSLSLSLSPRLLLLLFFFETLWRHRQTRDKHTHTYKDGAVAAVGIQKIVERIFNTTS